MSVSLLYNFIQLSLLIMTCPTFAMMWISDNDPNNINNIIPHKPIFYKRYIEDIINRRKET